MVLFPLESGKFKSNQVVIGSTYEVHGEPISGSPDATSSATPQRISTPYGVYTNPTFQSVTNPLPPHPPRSSKTCKIKKTIVMVTVSKKGKDRPKGNSKLDYTAVTQVVVSLTAAQCNVPAVTELVTQQVGFNVQLLDSKCYPLLTNEGTSGPEFWKSTRKILGASKSLYEKISGLSADMNIEQAIDLTDEPGPSQKRQRTELETPDATGMQLVLDKLTMVERKLSFLDELSQGFQCVICKSTAKTPVVSPCCQRVVGCESCVNNWVSSQSQESRCPLCSTSGGMLNRFALKGFNDALKIILGTTQEIPTPTQPDSDSDFEDPQPLFRGAAHD